MMRSAVLLALTALTFATASGSSAQDALAGAPNFNRDIRPLLSDRCFSCHGPDAGHRQADLRLDDESAAKAAAIISGDSEASPLYERIRSSDPDLVMPPPDFGKPLSPQQIELLRTWIDAGAPYESAWAYQPPTWRSAPSDLPQAWSTGHWIDACIYRELHSAQLSPSPPADPVTLVRRLHFDLTGLPPHPDTVSRFVADPSDVAYQQMVDELLASPAYGERLASWWLDLVRYADTVGYHGDQDHSIAPYRDWVVDSLNANIPFDQFTIAQLAGDLLPEPTTDNLIASGYNRLLQTSHEGGVQPKEYLTIYAADRVRNLSAVWLGATIGCAQCHDHKFDPYSIGDFYSLAAFFADIDEARHFTEGSNELPTKRPPEIRVLRGWQRGIPGMENRERLTMISKSIPPRTTRILPRGNWLDDSGPIVTPSVPAAFQQPLTTFSSTHEPNRASRLDLAKWLVSGDQGVGRLTARVMANRIWALLFGEGLSRSLEDFGGQGVPPTHPELLDNLAIEFYSSGFDLKHLIRQIVSSNTYKQASQPSSLAIQRDPENLLLSHQNHFRLPAEMIRDRSLAVAGLLLLDADTTTSRPYQPAGYYRHLNFPPREYKSDSDSNQFRRAVYIHWQRQFLHPMLRAFDAPGREECTAQRARSNTPLAALALLNDPSLIEASRGLAHRVLTDTSLTTDDQRLASAFKLITSREPDEFERSTLLELITANRLEFTTNPEQATLLLNVGISANESNVADSELATWCEVARALLNLNEGTIRP